MSLVTSVLLKSFITNVSLSVVKIVSGLIGSSGALIADGLHSFSDTLTDIFAIAGSKLSSKPADDKHPLGHGKIEYLTCLVIGVIVMAMGVMIFYEAICGKREIPSIYVSIVTLIVILAKLILSKYILYKGKKYHSNILIASGSESFSDVISSGIVFISILMAQLGKINPIFIYADTVAMIIVGILVVRIAYNILRENISNLVGEQVTDENYWNQISKLIMSFKEIMAIDSLIILKYGPVYHINCEVSMDEKMMLKDVHNILEKIEAKLKKFDDKIDHIIIHVNPYSG